jgi:hypothetical protein
MDVLKVLPVLVVVGCSPFIPVTNLKEVPPATMQAALNVRVHYGAHPAGDIAYLGQVVGHSCNYTGFDGPPSTSDALLRLRVEAAKAGANAVMDTACDSAGTDTWGTGCWASVSCKGTAVRVTR